VSVDVLVTAPVHAALTALLGVASHAIMGVLGVGTACHHASTHLIQTGRLHVEKYTQVRRLSPRAQTIVTKSTDTSRLQH